ncbi:MAG: hypothetical protein ACFB6R_14515 [Alphaproteobacteria bacterium]
MTVSTIATKVIYAGDGIATSFDIKSGSAVIVFQSNDQIRVTHVSAGGLETVWTEGTQYTVSGAGDAAGGRVTLSSAALLPVGDRLVLERIVPGTQPVDLEDAGTFQPQTIEDQLDRIAFSIQDLGEARGRSLQFPGFETGNASRLPTAQDRAGRALGFTGDGAGLAAGPKLDLLDTIVSQGLSTLSFADLNYVSTVAALTALTKPAIVTMVYVLGHTMVGDGGGGPFLWDPDDVTPANGVTILAADEGGDGRFRRLTGDGLINVRWAGAAPGRSAAVNAAAFTAALAVGSVFVPQGVYDLGANTIALKGDGKALIGEGPDTFLHFTGAQIGLAIGDIVVPGPDTRSIDERTTYREMQVRNLSVSGTGTRAVHLVKVTQCVVDRVHLRDAGLVTANSAWTDGFRFEFSFGSQLSNLYTLRAGIANHCFEFVSDFNANTVSNCYTGSTEAEAAFYMDKVIDCVFSSLTCQRTKVGIRCLDVRGCTINGPYFEQIRQPFVLGDRSSNTFVRGLTINGGEYLGPFAQNSDRAKARAIFDLQRVRGLTINGPMLSELFGYGAVAPVTFTPNGGDTPSRSANALALIAPDDPDLDPNPAGRIERVILLDPGFGYFTPPTVTVGSTAGGSGATVTAEVVGGRIARLTLTDQGSGYMPAVPTQIFALYEIAENVRVNGYYSEPQNGLGIPGPLWPFIARTAQASPNMGINVSDDVVLDGRSGQGRAEVIVSDGPINNNHAHIVVSRDALGTEIRRSFVPTIFPA